MEAPVDGLWEFALGGLLGGGYRRLEEVDGVLILML